MNKNKLKTLNKLFLLFLIIFLIAVRFLYLEADFPENITTSGVLYTDEGWYSSGAISHYVSGNWYVEGDFNPIITMPIFHLIQSLTFNIFGMSLYSARITVIIMFIILCFLIYLFLSKFAGFSIAIVSVILIASNFLIFSYSRLAIIELPMTTMLFLSFFIAGYPDSDKYFIFSIFCSFAFCLAVLTKLTAISGLPVILYILYQSKITIRDRIVSCLLFVIIFISIIVIYYSIMAHFFYEEFNPFTVLDISPKLSLTPSTIINNFIRTLKYCMFIDRIIIPLVITGLPIYFILSKFGKKNRMLFIFVLWVCFHILVESTSTYQVPRYVLPISIPFIILFSVMIMSLYRSLSPGFLSFIPVITIASVIAINAYQIANYLKHPKYSFLTMAEDIKIRMQNEKTQNNILLGSISNSISLVTNTLAIDDRFGTRDLRWILKQHNPGFYVALGVDEETLRIISESHNFVKIDSYDVFENYYGGKHVHFYKISNNPLLY